MRFRQGSYNHVDFSHYTTLLFYGIPPYSGAIVVLCNPMFKQKELDA